MTTADKKIFSITIEEWNKALESGELVRSPDDPPGFLMFGQRVASYVVYKGKTYYASLWSSETNVTLEEK